MKQWQEDKITEVQIRCAEYVLLELLGEGIINENTTLDNILTYCADYLLQTKQTYLDNKKRECYDDYSNKDIMNKGE